MIRHRVFLPTRRLLLLAVICAAAAFSLKVQLAQNPLPGDIVNGGPLDPSSSPGLQGENTANDSIEDASVVKFVDVTAASNLCFQHHNSATSNKYLIETMTGGVAVFDYDNDGWPDLLFVK